MSNLKKILSEYEGQYDPKAWAQFEKRLPKPGFMQRFGKFIVGGAVGALVVAGVLVAILWNNDEKPQTEEPIAQAEISVPQQTDYANENEISSTEQSSAMPNDGIPVSNQTVHNEVVETANAEIGETVVENSEPAMQNEVPSGNEKHDNVSSAQENQTKPAPKVVTEPSFSVSCDNHCAPATASFAAVGIDAECEIAWDFGNGTKANGGMTTCVYDEKGTYSPVASLYRGGKFVARYNLDDIEINEAPKVDFSWRSTDNIYTFYTGRTLNIDYSWEIDGKTFDDKSVEYEFVRSGDYPVRLVLTEGECSSESTKSVKVVISHVYFVPNAFTPDSEGVNATFGPIGEDMDFKTFSFGITSSRGDVVFTSADPKTQWNGKVNNVGRDVEAGVYYWVIKTVDNYGNSQTRKGTVNVMR